MRRSARGQTLLLLALTLLTLTLMVCVTLAVGVHVKRKMELNTLAEAAAYSNAVATARTYNTYSILNRAMISHWVAAAGTESLIAWATTYQAYLNGYAAVVQQLRVSPFTSSCTTPWDVGTVFHPQPRINIDYADYYFECPQEYASPPLFGPPCDEQIDAVTERLKAAALAAFPRGWGALDAEAGAQLRGIRQEIRNLGALQQQMNLQLQAVLREQTLTRATVGLAVQSGAPITVAPGTIALREAGGATTPGVQSASVPASDPRATSHRLALLNAALDSRGDAFMVSGTEDHPPAVDRELLAISAQYPAFVFGVPQRPSSRRTDVNGFFSATLAQWDGSTGDDDGGLGWGSATAVAWGDVHVTFTGCGRTVKRGSHVHGLLGSTTTGVSKHWWTGHFDSASPIGEAAGHHPGEGTDADHDLGPSDGFGILGGGFAFLWPQNAFGDAWGQPKVPVALVRAYGPPNEPIDPWNLTVNFALSGGSGTTLSLQAAGTQGAVATGLAYYHRREHWAEPPNFLNPFWRASLAPLDVDEQLGHLNVGTGGAKPDAERLLAAQGPEALRAWQALIANGYQGGL